MKKRRLLVTAALPYANGPIHIGHLVEYIQTDIWVRFQRLRGHEVLFVCADDTHGTAIMIRAGKEGITEQELIARSQAEHERDFAGFQISFDNYGSTHSDENRKICGEIWAAIRAAGLVIERDVQQLFDTTAGTFLADRFVRGTCPKCKAPDQPGDNCSACGETYTTAELIDPVSTLSGTRPEIRSAPHLFIQLEQLHDSLDEWTQNGEKLQKEIANYLRGHFLGDSATTVLGELVHCQPPIRRREDLQDIHFAYLYHQIEGKKEEREGKINRLISILPGEDLPARRISQILERLNSLGIKKKDITSGTAFSANDVAPPKKWLDSQLLSRINKLNLRELKDWDISRPAPYFGFEIPDSPGNYWYVWFDAPVGYIASTQQWCDRNGQKLDDWWKNPEVEIHHFLGKDITYFHTLFWPGMLKTAGFNLPEKIHIHGFLTVNGEKMSKSKGTFIGAAKWLEHADPMMLRYFYASKLSSRVDDLDLNMEEFANRINADLIGRIINIASRSAKFVETTGLSEVYPDDDGLFAAGAARGAEIAEAWESCDYQRAIRIINDLADQSNPYVENARPWDLKKDPARAQELQDVCTVALNLFRQLVIYLAPVLPQLAADTGDLLNDPIVSWDQSQKPLTGTAIKKFRHLMKRVDPVELQKMIDESLAENAVPASEETAAAASQWNDSDDALKAEPMAEECTIDDFVKVDLRVARIIRAEHVEEARKLLKLTLSLGGDNVRTVFAGIKAAYEPEKLEGRLVVVVANLKPRQMKFGLSEGMVCAAGGGGAEVFLLSPDSGAVPGQRVH